MKHLATPAHFIRALKHHTESLLPSVGVLRYALKHKIGFNATLILRMCHFTTVKHVVGRLSGCFGLWERKNRPGYEEFVRLAAETVFNVSEVETLYELFKKLSNCAVGDGLIHKENFRLALLRNTKGEIFFADRVFTLFDAKKSGVIAFGEFVRSLSVFHPDTSCEEKVDFAFKLYDLRQTGLIEREEVEKMLIALLSESEMPVSSELVTAILDKTFSEVDLKQEGKIDREEWTAFVSEHPSLMKIMTLPYLKAVTASFPSFIFSPEAEDNL